MFDARRHTSKLISAGMPEQQAHAWTDALEHAMEEAFGSDRSKAASARESELLREMKWEFARLRSDIQLLQFLGIVALIILTLIMVIIPAR